MCRIVRKNNNRRIESLNKTDFDSLSLCMWNVNGIISGLTKSNKLEDPDFSRVISGHDIIALIETKVSPTEAISLQGYSTYRRDRPKSRNERHYGGLAILIRNEIRKAFDVKIIQQTSDYIWLKIDRSKIKNFEDIYICIAYIPPCNSE